MSLPLQVSGGRHLAAGHHPRALRTPVSSQNFISLLVAWAAYFPGLSRGSTETTCDRNRPATKRRANRGITSITVAS